MKNTNEIFRAIESACQGLIYISETDAPILPFTSGRVDVVNAEIVRKNTNAQKGVLIEERTFDEFFDRLTMIRDWYGERETQQAKKFLELKQTLEEYLRDLKIFRIGSRRIDIFVAGLDPEGNLTGVTTKAVET